MQSGHCGAVSVLPAGISLSESQEQGVEQRRLAATNQKDAFVGGQRNPARQRISAPSNAREANAQVRYAR